MRALNTQRNLATAIAKSENIANFISCLNIHTQHNSTHHQDNADPKHLSLSPPVVSLSKNKTQ